MNDMTKLSFNAAPKTMTALNTAAGHANLSRTDTLNRATQMYAGLTRLSLWKAIGLLLTERATVRRWAAERKADR